MLTSEEEDQAKPLLPNAHFKRTGNLWTAFAHIITGVIGSKVLSLAWCVAQLGWIAGPLSMFMKLMSPMHFRISLCMEHSMVFGIAYTITAAISMRAIQKSNCYHKEGHNASCSYGDTKYMLIFECLQYNPYLLRRHTEITTT
ncbi:hypothetical protein V2J09_002670 [Rumex salicifolius]